MKKSLSFYNKLLVYFILVGVIPLMIIGSITYGFSKRFFLEQYSKQAYNKVSGITEKLDSLYEEYSGIMRTLSDMPELRQQLLQQETRNAPDIEQRIHMLLAGKKDKAAIYIIRGDGELYVSTHPLPAAYNPKKYRDWGIFRTAHMEEERAHAYAHRIIESDGRNTVLSMIQTINNASGELLGYIIVDFNRNHIMGLVGQNETSFSMDFLIVDNNSFTVINTKYPELEGTLDRSYRTILSSEDGELGAGVLKNSQGQLLQSEKSSLMKLSAIGYSPETIIRQNTKSIQMLFAIAAIISLCICVWFAYRVSKKIFMPIHELAHAMKRVTMGDLSARIYSKRHDEFGIVSSGFNTMAVQIQDLLASVKEEQRRLRMAEIKALQAQLNPHFIYNTLDLIKWNAKLNNTEQINQIVVQLAKMLRGMIHVKDEIISIKDEIALINNYLVIQQIRFINQLFIDIRIDQALENASIPRLLLHPLIENAIIHGFEKKRGNVYLSISGTLQGEEMLFEITDNGIGMSEETLSYIQSGSYEGGIGVSNVRTRIKLYYGEAYDLQIFSKPSKGTRIIFRLPYKTGGLTNHDQSDNH